MSSWASFRTANLPAAEHLHGESALPPLSVLPLGIPSLDEVLPQQGLVHGSVVELQVRGSSGAATSFALCACRAAQSSLGKVREVNPNRVGGGGWCAFIDPTATLFAPGVLCLGVDLKRLLVVRPDLESVGRVAIRIAETNIVSMLVLDLRGALNDLSPDDRSWQRIVRRLSLALRSKSTCALLITRAERRQSLPLPTFMRLEFTRRSRDSFDIRVAKDRTGQISAPRTIAWEVFDRALSRSWASPLSDAPSWDMPRGIARVAS